MNEGTKLSEFVGTKSIDKEQWLLDLYNTLEATKASVRVTDKNERELDIIKYEYIDFDFNDTFMTFKAKGKLIKVLINHAGKFGLTRAQDSIMYTHNDGRQSITILVQ